jgi:hypothetical protein
VSAKKPPKIIHTVNRQWRTIQYFSRKGNPIDSERRLSLSCTCGFEDDVYSDSAAERSVTEHKLDVLLSAAGIEFNVFEHPDRVEEE